VSTPPLLPDTSKDPPPALLDPAIIQLGPLAASTGGHTPAAPPAGGQQPPAAPPAGGPQPGSQRFGIVFTRRARSLAAPEAAPAAAAPATEVVAPAAASVAPLAPLVTSAPPPAAPVVQPPAAPATRPVTRSQTGSLRTVQRYGFSASVASPVPANYRSDLADPNWRAAMADEYKALIDNGTWRLVPRPLVLTLSLGSGCSNTNFTPTAPSPDTRRAGSSAASPRRPALTTMRPSARLSSRPRSAPSLALLRPEIGPYANST
jgi:hypothetical protein